MGDMLSQAEIDALLNGTFSGDSAGAESQPEEGLTDQESDALGEIGNISMGTSATTLFTLLGQKVNITTPQVTLTSWEEMQSEFADSYVAVRVEYTMGLLGTNLLILKESDVKIITDLMMGGDGGNTSGELTDLHLSAISEAMNQMVGSSATSMSSMFNERIDISPPKAFMLNFDEVMSMAGFSPRERFVRVSFKMIIGTLIDSYIMQLLPMPFAKSLVGGLLHAEEKVKQETAKPAAPAPVQQKAPAAQQAPQAQQAQQAYYQEPVVHQDNRSFAPPVNVQNAQFQNFDDGRVTVEKKNIGLIMDVPLQVTVELGRTNKLIKDILEFSPGSIIELDKLSGEPVDILVNGKIIAKGEVVVIDESFGVRITDIVHPSRRLG